MDNKTAIKVMLCEMVIKSEDVKTQSEIETLTSDIADRIVKLFAIPAVIKSVCEHKWKQWEDSNCNGRWKCTRCKEVR